MWGGNVATTVRTLGKPEDDNDHSTITTLLRRSRAVPKSASASDGLEDFGGGSSASEIVSMRTGRKVRRQEEGGGTDKARLLFRLVRDGDLFSLVRFVDI